MLLRTQLGPVVTDRVLQRLVPVRVGVATGTRLADERIEVRLQVRVALGLGPGPDRSGDSEVGWQRRLGWPAGVFRRGSDSGRHGRVLFLLLLLLFLFLLLFLLLACKGL